MYSKTLKKILFIPLMLAISFSIGLPQERESVEPKNGDAVRIDEIVVTATKTEINKKETGVSITVITEKEIEQRGKQMVIDVLRDVPGIQISQYGAFGGVSSILMRGAKPRHVLVLIDGVEMNDPSNPDRSFDFANLTTDNIERIEVIRGSQSTLYGSDATGGVINIITKKGVGKPKLTIKAEAGSYSTFRELVSVNGSASKVNYSFSASRTDICGFSKAARAPNADSEPEKDRYENTTVSSRLGYSPFGNSWITLSLRYTDAYTEIDDEAYDDDPNRINDKKQFSSRLSFTQPIFEWWEHKLSLDYMTIERRDRDEVDAVEPNIHINSWYQGTHKKGEWQHILSIGEIDEVTGGIEYEVNSATSLDYSDWFGFGATGSAFDEKSVRTMALYAQNHLKLFKRIFATAGIRLNDHEEFGRETTYQFSGSIIAPVVDTRFRGSYGTGFQAPSLLQLYDPTYGNTDLKPEESRSYDIGIEQPLWGNRFIVEATYFSTNYKNMIGFEASKYVNKGKVETNGIECALQFNPIDSLRIDASYTYTREADDKETGERLIRRPKHQGSFYVNWAFLRANFNIGINYVGERDDSWWDEFYQEHKTEEDAYYIINIAASYQLLENFQIFGRVENLTDEEYENPVGYETPGRSYYGGLKALF
jgi:vitamin B12 transporter